MSFKYALFKPRESARSFLFSVVLMTGKMLFFAILLISLCAAGIVGGVAKAWIDTCPDLEIDKIGSQSLTSFIYDKNGSLITEFKGSENRIYVDYEDIPQQLINAVIAIEDARYYEHHGVDIKRIGGSLINNLTGGNLQGASTITCQLVKLTLLNADQTYKRKAQEAYLALQLEKQMTKEEILEAYLNVIYLGGSNYGIKIAAQDYFGKELNQLSLRECACLAAIIRNPYRYNPRRNYYVYDDSHLIDERTDWVLREMEDHQLISKEEYSAALADGLSVLESSTASSDAMYDNAYYVEYSIYDVVTKMLRVEGLEDNSANRSAMETKLRNGGYIIYTSLDPVVQSAVQNVVTNWSSYPAMRYANDSSTQASLGGGEYLTVVQPQAAAAVVNWHTGSLVAVVGGRSEPVQKKQLNRAYQLGKMPVGSALKPLAVYGPAFDMGYSPGTPVLNLPIEIQNWNSSNGYPNNFSGAAFTGVESMRTAINKSHNTSTAHVLMDYVGIENAVTYLLKLGIDPDHILATGAGLALGSSGASVIEMATAYGAIANGGNYLESYAFTQVLNPDGTVYIDVTEVQETRRVFKESTAYQLVDTLIGCVSPTDGTGSKAVFSDLTVAGKTGTNTNNIGVTFAGMTGYYAGAVWIGSDNYKPLESDATGGSAAAPLWGAIMQQVHELTGCTVNRGIMSGSASDYGLFKETVCGVSGMLPTSACENDVNGYPLLTDYYTADTVPTARCNMHRAVTVCRKTGMVATRDCNSTMVVGIIYIPEGHPLRNASEMEIVQSYFYGASTSEYSAGIGQCLECD